MKWVKIVLVVLIVLSILFIWGNSTLSMKDSGRESEWFRAYVNRILKFLHLSEISSYAIRKVAHVTEFAVLSVLLTLFWRHRPGIDILCGFIAAFLDESIQMFSKRGALISDVWVDLIGITIGFLVGRLILLIYNHFRKKRDY